jgi:hypothetical protein
MEDRAIEQRLAVLEQKIEESVVLTKRMYRVFMITGIITVALFVLPLVGLVFVIPSFMASYGSIGSLTNGI